MGTSVIVDWVPRDPAAPKNPKSYCLAKKDIRIGPLLFGNIMKRSPACMLLVKRPKEAPSHDTTHAMPDERSTAAFLFLYFLKTFFYRNIFSVSHFTVLYPYRPAGGGRGPAVRQGPTCK